MNKINLVLENFLLVLSNSRRFIIVERTRNENGTKSIVKQKFNKYIIIINMNEENVYFLFKRYLMNYYEKSRENTCHSDRLSK